MISRRVYMGSSMVTRCGCNPPLNVSLGIHLFRHVRILRRLRHILVKAFSHSYRTDWVNFIEYVLCSGGGGNFVAIWTASRRRVISKIQHRYGITENDSDSNGFVTMVIPIVSRGILKAIFFIVSGGVSSYSWAWWRISCVFAVPG